MTAYEGKSISEVKRMTLEEMESYLYSLGHTVKLGMDMDSFNAVYEDMKFYAETWEEFHPNKAWGDGFEVVKIVRDDEAFIMLNDDCFYQRSRNREV